ncbi:MAG: hypothetical protein WDN04_18420 [Rhodospirillales bacterium]
MGLLLHQWWLAAFGGAVATASIVGWLWPERALAQIAQPRHV